MTKWLADTVQEQQHVGGLSMSSISYCFAAINAWIIYRGVTGEEMSRHAFLRQIAEELREVYKEKRESMVPKHNEEEQSHDKRKASKRHQCQAGMCKRNKTAENVKYVSNMYVESAR